jgi:hypothetical protein
MEASEIRTGGRYGVRVGSRITGRTVEVRVLGPAEKGWLVLNVHSSRRLVVPSARKFLYDIDLVEDLAEQKARARAVVAWAQKKRPSISSR